jgi:hypothetical protein
MRHAAVVNKRLEGLCVAEQRDFREYCHLISRQFSMNILDHCHDASLKAAFIEGAADTS